MKDLLICFIIALVLGSMLNGWRQSADGNAEGTEPVDQSMGAPLSSVQDTNFQGEVLEQQQPVLVDFYTQACPHCKKMAPLLGQVAQEYASSLKVVKMDVMENPAIAHKYEIGGVPAFILFANGKPVESFVGEMSKTRLLSIIKPHLTPAAPGGNNNPA